MPGVCGLNTTMLAVVTQLSVARSSISRHDSNISSGVEADRASMSCSSFQNLRLEHLGACLGRRMHRVSVWGVCEGVWVEGGTAPASPHHFASVYVDGMQAGRQANRAPTVTDCQPQGQTTSSFNHSGVRHNCLHSMQLQPIWPSTILSSTTE